jgi:hypothetical protein
VIRKVYGRGIEAIDNARRGALSDQIACKTSLNLHGARAQA